MLYLDINKPTEVVVTLTENITIYTGTQGGTTSLPAYFTWKITDADTNREYIFTNDDISPAPWYYNMFTFSVIPGATYGATAGIIPSQQGVYTYEVYQTKNQYDLSTNSTLLETGILNIIGTYSKVNTFTQSMGNIVTFKNI